MHRPSTEQKRALTLAIECPVPGCNAPVGQLCNGATLATHDGLHQARRDAAWTPEWDGQVPTEATAQARR